MKNKIVDLRNHLFATIEALSDKDNPMQLERAKTIADVAQVIVNSVKVEVDFLRLGGEASAGTGFIPSAALEGAGEALDGKPQPRLVSFGNGK